MVAARWPKNDLQTLVSCPMTACFVQQAALSFLERGNLDAFATTFVYRPEGQLARVVANLHDPFCSTMLRQLGRRSVPLIPAGYIRTYPFWEIARTALCQAGGSPVFVDRVWDHMARDF